MVGSGHRYSPSRRLVLDEPRCLCRPEGAAGGGPFAGSHGARRLVRPCPSRLLRAAAAMATTFRIPAVRLVGPRIHSTSSQQRDTLGRNVGGRVARGKGPVNVRSTGPIGSEDTLPCAILAVVVPAGTKLASIPNTGQRSWGWIRSQITGRPELATPKVLEGQAPFRDYTTWYRVTGDLSATKVPLVVLHGGPGCTHDYVELVEGRRRHGSSGRALRSARQRPLHPPARQGRRFLDGRAIPARTRQPHPASRHRSRLPRVRPILGRHAGRRTCGHPAEADCARW